MKHKYKSLPNYLLKMRKLLSHKSLTPSDKTVLQHVVDDVEQLIQEIKQKSFFERVQQQPVNRDIATIRMEFDAERKSRMAAGLIQIISKYKLDKQRNPQLVKVHAWLNESAEAISMPVYHNQNNCVMANIYILADIYASHFIPFNQSNDPLLGGEIVGFCWGHAKRHGKLAANNQLNQLSIANDVTLYRQQKAGTNIIDWTFRYKALYKIKHTKDIENSLWRLLDRIDFQHTYALCYRFNGRDDGHATSIRRHFDGIEFYDSNIGLLRFASQQQFVDFMILYFDTVTTRSQTSIKQIELLTLPHRNRYARQKDVIDQHLVGINLHTADEKAAMIHKLSNAPAYTTDAAVSNIYFNLPNAEGLFARKLTQLQAGSDQTSITKAQLHSLRQHRHQLNKRSYNDHYSAKAQVKRAMLDQLIKDLELVSIDQALKQVQSILDNKHHGLMRTRGISFYPLYSKHKGSQTRTEDKLKDLRDQLQLTA